ncbi:AAA family ATPase [Sphingobacterium sp. Mn56C]|uniref:AAA family ATPase n=1 Tax=Sphingobacterium sp. Mn56C TaxID=3395261 RepID=UPI003BD6CF86
MEKKITKIAVVGPESTGKSTMAQYLAQQLDTLCVPEYARYYCQGLNNQYTLADETNMFYGQIALEDAMLSQVKNNLLICDTTLLTVKIWCDYLFQHTPAVVRHEIQHRPYDLYLLMDIDLPWQDDPLRDFPNERGYFFEVWQKELQALHANYAIVSGLGEERLKNGLAIIKQNR